MLLMKKIKSMVEQIQLLQQKVERNSLRLGYKLNCYLYPLNNQEHEHVLDQRKNLRKFLTKEIEHYWPNKLSIEQKKQLLTPGNLPQVPFASLSVSHSSFIGGFIISPATQVSLGFDLEQAGRAKKRTVLRIASEEELQQSPSPSALWSVKEAIYKSIHPLQNSIHVKQISVFGWAPILEIKNPDALTTYDYQFEVKNKKGKGFVCSSDKIIIAVSFYIM